MLARVELVIKAPVNGSSNYNCQNLGQLKNLAICWKTCSLKDEEITLEYVTILVMNISDNTLIAGNQQERPNRNKFSIRNLKFSLNV